MPTLLSPVAIQQFKDNNGNPLAGGQLYTYAAGTSTPQPSYTDATGTSANSNPVILNSRGEAPLWLTPGQFYKLVLMDASNVMIWTADQVPGGFVDAALLLNTTSSNLVRTDLALNTDATKGASLVGYSDNFAPAYLKTVSDILNGAEVSMLRFIDRTKHAAIRARTNTDDLSSSFDAAMASGVKKIAIPFGKYYKLTPTTIPGQMSIRGDGTDATSITGLSATADIWVVGNNATRQENISLKDMTIESNIARTAGRFVYVKNCYNTTTSNLFLKQPFLGMELDSVVAYADQIRVDNAVASTGVGILISGGNDHFVSNVMGNAPPASQPQALIKMTSSQASWIRDVDAIACGSGLLIAPAGANTVAWTWFTNVAADQGNSHGIYLAPTGGANIRGAHFNQCWAGTNALDGFRADTIGGNIDSLELDGFRSYSNGQNGVLFSGGANFKMMGGSVGGNNTVGGTFYGVAAIGNTAGFTLEGVRSGNPAALAATQSAGIFVDAGVTDVTLIGNDGRGNVGAAIIDNSTTTSKTIIGNRGYQTNSQGVASIAIGQTSVAINHGLPVAPGFDCISLTPVQGFAQQQYTVSTINSTQFSIVIAAAAAGAAVNFQWSARVKGA